MKSKILIFFFKCVFSAASTLLYLTLDASVVGGGDYFWIAYL